MLQRSIGGKTAAHHLSGLAERAVLYKSCGDPGLTEGAVFALGFGFSHKIAERGARSQKRLYADFDRGESAASGAWLIPLGVWGGVPGSYHI